MFRLLSIPVLNLSPPRGRLHFLLFLILILFCLCPVTATNHPLEPHSAFWDPTGPTVPILTHTQQSQPSPPQTLSSPKPSCHPSSTAPNQFFPSGQDDRCSLRAQPENFRHLRRWPRLCVGVRVYREQLYKFPILLHSLLDPGYPNLAIFLNNPRADDSLELYPYADAVNQLGCCNPQNQTHDSADPSRPNCPIARVVPTYNLTWLTLRNPGLSAKTNDYGYIGTDFMLEWMLRPEFQCDLMMFTNSDNFYLPEFIPSVVIAANAGYQLIGTHFISHYHFLPHWIGASYRRAGKNSEVYTHFRITAIDLGAMVIASNVFRRYSFRFVAFSPRVAPTLPSSVMGRFNLRHWNWAELDGALAYRIASVPDVSRVIIRRALFVHE